MSAIAGLRYLWQELPRPARRALRPLLLVTLGAVITMVGMLVLMLTGSRITVIAVDLAGIACEVAGGSQVLRAWDRHTAQLARAAWEQTLHAAQQRAATVGPVTPSASSYDMVLRPPDLCGHSTSRQRRQAARPNTPGDILVRLACHQDPLVRLLVAGNLSSSPWVLQVLARDQQPGVRTKVAARQDCPPGTLGDLLADPAPQVRVAARDNGTLSSELLRQLAGSSSTEVRLAAASHRCCPPGALRILAADPDDAVRRRVADHPGCPPGTLGSLLQDPDPAVRRAALGNSNLPSYIRAMYELASGGAGG